MDIIINSSLLYTQKKFLKVIKDCAKIENILLSCYFDNEKSRDFQIVLHEILLICEYVTLADTIEHPYHHALTNCNEILDLRLI